MAVAALQRLKRRHEHAARPYVIPRCPEHVVRALTCCSRAAVARGPASLARTGSYEARALCGSGARQEEGGGNGFGGALQRVGGDCRCGDDGAEGKRKGQIGSCFTFCHSSEGTVSAQAVLALDACCHM
jgi:hypothetical protein